MKVLMILVVAAVALAAAAPSDVVREETRVYDGYDGYSTPQELRLPQTRGRFGLGWDHRTIRATSLKSPIYYPTSFEVVGQGYFRGPRFS